MFIMFNVTFDYLFFRFAISLGFEAVANLPIIHIIHGEAVSTYR